MKDDTKQAPKKRGTSLVLLIAFCCLGVAGYYAGPTILTYTFLLQEKYIAATRQNGGWFSTASDAPIEPSSDPSQLESTANGPEIAGSSGENGSEGNEGGFDPDSVFLRRDADGNGKLEGEEITERIQGRITELDKDGDGAVSKEEFLSGMASRNGDANGN
jgi:hypothetical protein